jgi:hypothetical protein
MWLALSINDECKVEIAWIGPKHDIATNHGYKLSRRLWRWSSGTISLLESSARNSLFFQRRINRGLSWAISLALCGLIAIVDCYCHLIELWVKVLNGEELMHKSLEPLEFAMREIVAIGVVDLGDEGEE